MPAHCFSVFSTSARQRLDWALDPELFSRDQLRYVTNGRHNFPPSRQRCRSLAIIKGI